MFAFSRLSTLDDILTSENMSERGVHSSTAFGCPAGGRPAGRLFRDHVLRLIFSFPEGRGDLRTIDHFEFHRRVQQFRTGHRRRGGGLRDQLGAGSRPGFSAP